QKPGAPQVAQGSTGQQSGGTPSSASKDGKTSGSGGEPSDKPGAGDRGRGTAAGGSKGQESAQSNVSTNQSARTGNGSGVARDTPNETPANGWGQPSSVPKETTGKLFQPATSPPSNSTSTSSTGASSGDRDGPLGGRATRLGKTGRVPDFDNLEAITSPTEREAVLKLQQAVQRIKANRERRGNSPVRPGAGSPAADTKRAW